MKILLDKLVIAAFVLSVLIVLGAYFGGRWLYKIEPELTSTPTVSVPLGVFTDEGTNFDGADAQEYGDPDSKSPDSDESSSSSEWHEDEWNMPEPKSVSEITDEEREAAMRQIRWEKERIKELQAGLPPLMVANPAQFQKELEQHLDRVMNETEKLLNGAVVASNKDSVVLPQLPDLESLYLETAQLRRELEEYHSQHPDEPLITAAIERLERMEASRDEDEASAEKLAEKLNEEGIGF
jgi:hypothetical protein